MFRGHDGKLDSQYSENAEALSMVIGADLKCEVRNIQNNRYYDESESGSNECDL